MGRTQLNNGKPWIDLYTGLGFRGTLHRLCIEGANRSTEFPKKDLPIFRSFIVGPGVVAQVHLQEQTRPIRFSPKTVLPDASRRLDVRRVSGLTLVSR